MARTQWVFAHREREVCRLPNYKPWQEKSAWNIDQMCWLRPNCKCCPCQPIYNSFWESRHGILSQIYPTRSMVAKLISFPRVLTRMKVRSHGISHRNMKEYNNVMRIKSSEVIVNIILWLQAVLRLKHARAVLSCPPKYWTPKQLLLNSCLWRISPENRPVVRPIIDCLLTNVSRVCSFTCCSGLSCITQTPIARFLDTFDSLNKVVRQELITLVLKIADHNFLTMSNSWYCYMFLWN